MGCHKTSHADVKRLIREIITNGTVYYSKHARQEMANDNLSEIDCSNVMRGGVVGEGEWENGSWRYRWGGRSHSSSCSSRSDVGRSAKSAVILGEPPRPVLDSRGHAEEAQHPASVLNRVCVRVWRGDGALSRRSAGPWALPRCLRLGGPVRRQVPPQPPCSRTK